MMSYAVGGQKDQKLSLGFLMEEQNLRICSVPLSPKLKTGEYIHVFLVS